MKNPTSCRLLSAALVCGGVVSTSFAAPVYWDPMAGGNGHWYEPVKVETTITWEAAKVAAEAVGGYLTTLTSSSENDFVYSLISDSQYWAVTYVDFLDLSYIPGPMIGLLQPDGSSEPGGDWQWLNGDGGVEVTFSNWHATEPDNNAGTQHRGLFFNLIQGLTQPIAGNAWGDIDGSAPYHSYVVEWTNEPQDVPEPSTYAAAGFVAALAGFQLWRRRAGAPCRRSIELSTLKLNSFK